MPAQQEQRRHFYLSVFIRVIRVRQLGRPLAVDMVATLKILEKSITKSEKNNFKSEICVTFLIRIICSLFDKNLEVTIISLNFAGKKSYRIDYVRRKIHKSIYRFRF